MNSMSKEQKSVVISFLGPQKDGQIIFDIIKVHPVYLTRLINRKKLPSSI